MFTKNEARAIAERVRIASQEELGDKYEVIRKGGSYAQTLVIKLEVAKADPSGTIQTQTMLDFLAMATQVGLEPEDLGAQVRFDGQWFEIVGLKPRAWKRPITIKNVRTGKHHVTSAESVQQAKQMGRLWWQPAS